MQNPGIWDSHSPSQMNQKEGGILSQLKSSSSQFTSSWSQICEVQLARMQISNVIGTLNPAADRGGGRVLPMTLFKLSP